MKNPLLQNESTRTKKSFFIKNVLRIIQTFQEICLEMHIVNKKHDLGKCTSLVFLRLVLLQLCLLSKQ